MIRSLYCVLRQAAVLTVPSLLGDLTSASKKRDFFRCVLLFHDFHVFFCCLSPLLYLT